MNGYAIIAGRNSHLTEGMLIAVLDGEADIADIALSHLSSCPDCAVRLDRLRDASAAFTAWLPPVFGGPPDRAPSAPTRLALSYPAAAAAVFLVVASAAAATTPVREWISHRLSGTVETPAIAPTPPERVSRPPASRGMVMSFSPGDSLLTIRFERRQPRGELELLAAPGDRVSAQITDRASGEELFVLPTELRIANQSGSSADYQIALPASVRAVRLIIGNAAAIFVRYDPGLHRRVPLK